MDTRIIGEGATVHFPVFASGRAPCSRGLHAAMGDGEICGTGIEIPGRASSWPWRSAAPSACEPVVETDEAMAAVASAETLDEAAEQATRHMADLLHRAPRPAGDDPTTLMSAAGQLQVSQVVDPLKTARFAMSKELLAPFGRLL